MRKLSGCDATLLALIAEAPPDKMEEALDEIIKRAKADNSIVPSSEVENFSETKPYEWSYALTEEGVEIARVLIKLRKGEEVPDGPRKEAALGVIRWAKGNK